MHVGACFTSHPRRHKGIIGALRSAELVPPSQSAVLVSDKYRDTMSPHTSHVVPTSTLTLPRAWDPEL